MSSNMYLVDGSFMTVVQEPQYPDLVTVLSERHQLLDHAHPGGSGAVCRTNNPDFPYAIHAERWALSREFWSLRNQDIPRLNRPVTPTPQCWRYEGVRFDHSGQSDDAEAVTGYVGLHQLDSAKRWLSRQLDCLGFYPWFDVVSSTRGPRTPDDE